MTDSAQTPCDPPASDPLTGAHRREPNSWVALIPWVLAAGFALCCVVLLALAFALRREIQQAERRLEESRRNAADLRRQVNSANEESRTNATNFQARLADFQRLTLQRTAESERAKRALQDELQTKTAALARERSEFQRRLTAKAGDIQALEEAVAKVTLENKERLTHLNVLLLRPTADASSAIGVVVWDRPQQRGLVRVENLGTAPPGQDHQLWLHDPKYPIPISAGVLPAVKNGSMRHGFKPLFTIEHLTKVTVTLERRGGVDKPQGKVVMESP